MRNTIKQLAGVAAVTLSAIAIAVPASAGTLRVALGDVASVETLNVLVALERAKEKGLDYEITSFGKEGLAIQAIVSDQMDVAIGSPYAILQKSSAPLRNLFQVSKLAFFPVVSKEYKTWQDLDGQPFAFHARGTGTEAIGDIIVKREGITLGDRSYIPGSENRIVAMMRGQVKASIVDLSNKNILMEKAGDRFHVLPGVSADASDEILFANTKWMAENKEDLALLVEAFLKTWRDMSEDPSVIDRERKRFNLLSDLPKELLEDVDGFYKEAVEGGLYDANGGGKKAALADFGFFVDAGQLKGPASELKVDDFWDLAPLENAKKNLSK